MAERIYRITVTDRERRIEEVREIYHSRLFTKSGKWTKWANELWADLLSRGAIIEFLELET